MALSTKATTLSYNAVSLARAGKQWSDPDLCRKARSSAAEALRIIRRTPKHMRNWRSPEVAQIKRNVAAVKKACRRVS